MTDDPHPSVENREESSFERYRSYLLVLAEMSLDRGVRAKVSPSDAVQLTLIEAWRNAKRLARWSVPQQLAWFRTTLAHIVSRTQRDLRRRKRDLARERSLETCFELASDVLSASFAAGQSSPSASAMRRESLLEVTDALASLPAAQRQAVLLYYIEGRSLEQIGRVLARSPAAAGGLIRRGLRRLREILGHQGQPDEPPPETVRRT